MVKIRYYVAADGRQPFAEWFADLEPVTRAKIARAVARMGQGNLSNVKPVGGGVLEYRIDFGPGDPRLFRARPRDAGHPADRRQQEAAAARYRGGRRVLAGL
jgi:putative addiction module killer protein